MTLNSATQSTAGARIDFVGAKVPGTLAGVADALGLPVKPVKPAELSHLAGAGVVVVSGSDPNLADTLERVRRMPGGAEAEVLVLIEPDIRLPLPDPDADWISAEAPTDELRARIQRLVRRSGTHLDDEHRTRLWLYESILNLLPDLIGVVDRNGSQLLLNRSGRRMLGIAEDTPVETVATASLHPPETLDVLEKQVWPVMRRDGHWAGNTEMLARDGTVIPTWQMFFTVMDEHGEQLWTATMARDLREELSLRARVDQAALEGEVLRRRLESVMEMTPDLVGMTTMDGRQIYLNASGRRMLGYPPDIDIVGRPISEVHPPELVPNLLAEIFRTARDTGSWSGESELVRFDDGTRVPVWQVLVFVEQGDSKEPVMCTFMRDLRDLHALEEQVAAADQARLEAEEAGLAKGRFLATMSHEIRTPLNAVLGYAQLLELEELEAEQMDTVRSIRRAGGHLLALVNDILDLSRIEAGAVGLHLQPTDLVLLLTDLADTFAQRCAEKGLGWRLDLSALPPGHRVLVDRQRLTQVCNNLLDNSVKFTSAGEVTLAARLDDALHVVLDVADTGKGMTVDELTTVFAPFQQGGAGRLFGGTGLGLAIVRNIIDMMGGRIRMVLRKPQGLRTVVTLPLRPTEAAPEGSETGFGSIRSADDAHTLGKALVVDDNEDNRRVLSATLTRLGMEVEEACDGAEALDWMEGEEFDAVFLDIRMPHLDGYAALAEAQRRWPERHTRYVAVTATGLRTSRGDYLARGFDGFVKKPFHISEIALLVNTLGELPDTGEVRGQGRSERNGHNEPIEPGVTPAQTNPEPRPVGPLRARHLSGDIAEDLREMAELGMVTRLGERLRSLRAAPKLGTGAADDLEHLLALVAAYDLDAVLLALSGPTNTTE